MSDEAEAENLTIGSVPNAWRRGFRSRPRSIEANAVTMAKRNKAKKALAQRWEKSSRPVLTPKEPRNLRLEIEWLLPALVLGFLVYTNTLGGEFAYDDQRQIAWNTFDPGWLPVLAWR